MNIQEAFQKLMDALTELAQSFADAVAQFLRSDGSIYAENPDDHLDRYEEQDGYWRSFIHLGGDELDIEKGRWLVIK